MQYVKLQKTADRNNSFSLDQVDFSKFGLKLMDVDFEARTILWDSQGELESLISLTSDTSGDSSASVHSSMSLGLPGKQEGT